MSAAPFSIKWTAVDSAQAHHAWLASCGPHAIAAALGLHLEEVRPHVGKHRGWMNPTMMQAALRSLRAPHTLTKGLRTSELCNGINRIQWEGPWLDPGVPVAVAYRHTHWVAHFDGWVLCTVLTSSEWRPVEEWRQFLASRKSPWHATHHYRLPLPPHA